MSTWLLVSEGDGTIWIVSCICKKKNSIIRTIEFMQGMLTRCIVIVTIISWKNILKSHWEHSQGCQINQNKGSVYATRLMRKSKIIFRAHIRWRFSHPPKVLYVPNKTSVKMIVANSGWIFSLNLHLIVGITPGFLLEVDIRWWWINAGELLAQLIRLL